MYLQKPFMTDCTFLSGWRPFNVSIMTTKTSLCFKIDSSKIYRALLERVSETLRTGIRKTASIEQILNVSEFMLCGKRSRDIENGEEVLITQLDENDAFDGSAFERAYASSAVVMYKD